MTPADDPTSIGNVLVELGYCTRRDVEYIAELMASQKRMGELMVEARVISQEQLEWALIYQQVLRGEAPIEDAATFEHQQREQFRSEVAEINVFAMSLVNRLRVKAR